MPRFYALLFSALACTLGLTQAAPANGLPAWCFGEIPFRVNFVWRVDVRTGPTALGVNAPWYTYFPYDPNLMIQPATTPFPHWPSQFPPQNQGQNYGWTPPNAPAVMQPAGYAVPPAPGSWYGR